jgi:hypothetical protein
MVVRSTTPQSSAAGSGATAAPHLEIQHPDDAAGGAGPDDAALGPAGEHAAAAAAAAGGDHPDTTPRPRWQRMPRHQPRQANTAHKRVTAVAKISSRSALPRVTMPNMDTGGNRVTWQGAGDGRAAAHRHDLDDGAPFVEGSGPRGPGGSRNPLHQLTTPRGGGGGGGGGKQQRHGHANAATAGALVPPRSEVLSLAASTTPRGPDGSRRRAAAPAVPRVRLDAQARVEQLRQIREAVERDRGVYRGRVEASMDELALASVRAPVTRGFPTY